MGQTYSYEEYMPEKDIPNTFDGLEPERVEWEKKIGFLLLLQNFGTFGFFGSAKHNKLSNNSITRGDIKNYIESFEIKSYLDWIKECMPDKIINVITKDLSYLNFNLDDKIKNDDEYIKIINKAKYDLILEIFKNFTDENKIIIFERITKKFSSEFIGEYQIYKMYLDMYGEKIITSNKINDFFELFNVSHYNTLLDYIDKKYPKLKSELKKSIFNFNFKCSTDDANKLKGIINLEEKFELAKKLNNTDDKELFKLLPSSIINKIIEQINQEDKINFVNDYFANPSNQNSICKLSSSYQLSSIFEDLKENKLFQKLCNDTKYNLFKSKYYNELEDEQKDKYTKYRLDFNSHWELYKLDKKKYLEIILHNDLIDDYTFGNYSFDNFSFLDSFNDEVKTYLKNKIYSDTNQISEHDKRHTKISTLDNYIDIMYFTHNPPDFLKLADTKYYPDYIQVMNLYLENINYDFSKVTWLNVKPKVVFDIC